MIRYRAVISGATGLPGLFTAYFVGSTPATTAEGLEAASRVRAVWAALPSHLPSSASLTFGPTADVIDPSTGKRTGSLSFAAPAGLSGTGGTAQTPLGMCIQGGLRTGVFNNGREVRGRSFIGPLIQGDIAVGGVPGGTLTTAVATALSKLGVTIVTPLANVVWHRPPKGGTTGFTAAVTAYDNATVFTMLRSRRS